MPSAGAAPARKGAGRAEQAAPSTSLPEWFLSKAKKGWSPYDNRVADNKHRVCSGSIQLRIVDILERRTIGGNSTGRTESVVLTYKEIQEFGYEITKQAILDALGELSSSDFPLIEIEEVSHKKRRYRLLRDNFEKAPTVGPRKLNLGDDEEDSDEDEDEIDGPDAEDEDEDEIDGEIIANAQHVSARSVVHLTSKPVLFPLKKKYKGLLLGGKDAAVSLVACRGGFLKLDANALAGRKVREPENDPTQLGSLRPVENPSSPVNQSAPASIGEEWIATVARDLADPFSDYFHSMPDPELLRGIATDLYSEGEPTPVSYFWNVTVARRTSGGKRIKPGLLITTYPEGLPPSPGLARDAAIAWAALPQRIRAKYLPPTATVTQEVKPFDAEPEGTGSAWDRIRQEIRKQITPQEYENWFMRTRFVSLEWETLTVACPDAVTCDFYDSEYIEQLLQIANYDLELGIARFEWEVAS